MRSGERRESGKGLSPAARHGGGRKRGGRGRVSTLFPATPRPRLDIISHTSKPPINTQTCATQDLVPTLHLCLTDRLFTRDPSLTFTSAQPFAHALALLLLPNQSLPICPPHVTWPARSNQTRTDAPVARHVSAVSHDPSSLAWDTKQSAPSPSKPKGPPSTRSPKQSPNARYTSYASPRATALGLASPQLSDRDSFFADHYVPSVDDPGAPPLRQV